MASANGKATGEIDEGLNATAEPKGSGTFSIDPESFGAVKLTPPASGLGIDSASNGAVVSSILYGSSEVDLVLNGAVESTVSEFSQDLKQADGDRKRYHLSLLKKLPRYRDSALATIFPYYAIGHDITTSSMSGILFAPKLPAPRHALAIGLKAGILPGNGEFAYFRHDHGDQHITLDGLTDDERAKLNFFHGGCGDCRHVYATLYDLGRQLQSGSGDTLKGNRVHFVLNDSSHAILARCAVMLAGLEELARFPMEDIRKKERQDVNLLLAFLHYVLLSPVVPSYVHEKLREIMQRLVDDPTQYRSIRFDGDTWEGVRGILEIWLDPTKQPGSNLSRPAEEVVGHYRTKEHNEVMKNIGETVIEYGKIASDYLDSNHLDELAQLSPVQMDAFFSMLDNIGPNMARIVHSNLKALNVQGDVVFTAVHQVLPPPKQLLSFHSPAVQRCHQLAHNTGDEIREDGRLIEGITRCALHTAAEDFSHSTVIGEYCTNMTGIEPVTDPKLCRIYPDEAEVGMLAHHWNALLFIVLLHSSNVIKVDFSSEENPTTLFDLSSNLWEHVVFAMKHLFNESGSSLSYELADGDMNIVAQRMTLEAEERKAKNLPTKFLRVFTSNVPDYTGLIYPLIYMIPMLEPSPKAFFRCNALYIGLSTSKTEAWLRKVLVLNSAEETQAMYGIDLLTRSKMNRFLWLGNDLHTPSQPLTQDSLVELLHRLFIGIALPPLQVQKVRMDPEIFPETLVVFVEVLAAFLERGVDPRWVARAIEEMLEGDGKLMVRNPRLSKRSIDLGENGAVAVAPFLVELRTLLAIYQPILNLGISPQRPLPSIESIALRAVVWTKRIVTSRYEQVGVVMFPSEYDTEEVDVRRLALGFPHQPVPEDAGNIPPPAPRFFSVVSWSCITHIARFYLPDEEYLEMKRDKWRAALYSTVTYKLVTDTQSGSFLQWELQLKRSESPNRVGLKHADADSRY